jgi:predicted transposase YdaD
VVVDRLYRQGHSERLTKGLAEGKTEGLANGTERGIIIGRIQLLQQLLGLDISSNDDLLQLKLPQIHDLATSLEQRLKDKS